MDKTKKPILVTGGCGFIGSHLVDALTSEGHSVSVIDDLSTGLKNNRNKNARYFTEDIRSYIHDEKKIERLAAENEVEVVYHLAACADIRKSVAEPLFVYEVNLLSSIALLAACQKAKVKKFIFTSTSAVYGPPQYLPVDESHPTNPVSPYGLTKLAFEQYLRYANAGGLPTTIIFRLPNVYGPRQRPDLEGGVVSIFNNHMKRGEEVTFFGDGRQTRDWVHVDDIVKALVMALTHKAVFEIFPLGSERETSLRELFDSLKEIFRYNKKPVPAPERPGDVRHMVMSGKKAAALLGWKAGIPLEKGLRGIVEGKEK